MKPFTLTTTTVALAAAAAAGLAAFLPGAISPEQRFTLALIVIVVALWSTEAVSSYLASLILFAALLVQGLAPPDVVFSGFASSAIWLALSGFVTGAAIRATGLGEAFAAVVALLLTRAAWIGLAASVLILPPRIGFVEPEAFRGLGRLGALLLRGRYDARRTLDRSAQAPGLPRCVRRDGPVGGRLRPSARGRRRRGRGSPLAGSARR